MWLHAAGLAATMAGGEQGAWARLAAVRAAGSSGRSGSGGRGRSETLSSLGFNREVVRAVIAAQAASSGG